MTDQQAILRKVYPTDLTDDQRGFIELLLPAAKPEGQPREVNLRAVLNSILDLDRSGCPWDMLPQDLLPKSTAFEDFAAWRDEGTLTKILGSLRAQISCASRS